MNVSENITISAADLGLLATLSERIHDADPNEPFMNHLYSVLNEAVPRNLFTVDSYSINPVSFKQAVSVLVSDEMLLIFKSYLHQHPLLRYFASGAGDIGTILQVSSVDEFHKTDLYQKYYKIVGIEDQLVLMLRHSEGVYLVAYSRETAFSKKERWFMELLKPHLHIALKNWQRMRDLEQYLRTLENKVEAQFTKPVFETDHPVNLLTRRQQEIAGLVAQGLENQQIAEELHIAPKTVGKHIENIFTKLEINNRTKLAAIWQSGKSGK